MLFRSHKDKDLYSTSHKHCAFTTIYVRFRKLSLFASYAILIRPKRARNSCQGLLVFRLIIFMVDLRGKLRYQSGCSARYRGFKLAMKHENDVSNMAGCLQVVRIYCFTKEIKVY